MIGDDNETDSFVTQQEIDAMNADAKLKRGTPFLIRGVSQTQFSIARHFGGVTFNGEAYIYLLDTDELIRADVLKWLMSRRKKANKPKKPTMTQKTFPVSS